MLLCSLTCGYQAGGFGLGQPSRSPSQGHSPGLERHWASHWDTAIRPLSAMGCRQHNREDCALGCGSQAEVLTCPKNS